MIQMVEQRKSKENGIYDSLPVGTIIRNKDPYHNEPCLEIVEFVVSFNAKSGLSGSYKCKNPVGLVEEKRKIEVENHYEVIERSTESLKSLSNILDDFLVWCPGTGSFIVQEMTEKDLRLLISKARSLEADVAFFKVAYDQTTISQQEEGEL